MIQSKYRMVRPFEFTDKPGHLKTATGEELFDYIADCLGKFLKDNEDLRSKNKEYHLGFTFSYPCDQSAINHGVLQRWTKGFDVKGVEGQDVVPLFEAALKKRGVPIKVTAVVNDTTGTLIASNYADPNTKIGCIFGTGISHEFANIRLQRCIHGELRFDSKTRPFAPSARSSDGYQLRMVMDALRHTDSGVLLTMNI
jgi:hexokinase